MAPHHPVEYRFRKAWILPVRGFKTQLCNRNEESGARQPGWQALVPAPEPGYGKMAIVQPSITPDTKQGHTTGTLIARVGDVSGVVREVNFYRRLEGDAAPGVGPFPADIVRRPASDVSVYEYDVVRAPGARTIVQVQLVLEDGTPGATAERIFDARSADAAVGVGGEVRVQDSDTPAVAVSTLVFQGSAVSVANGVATLNLDSRYAQLSGAAFTGDVSAAAGRAILGVDSFNGNAKLELGSSTAGGTVPYIDFHHGVGAEQDYNARLMNNASNLLTVAFAGAGTFNVQGTIQQYGVAVSLAGHAHAALYHPLNGAINDAQLTANIPRYDAPGRFVGQLTTGGAAAAFHFENRSSTTQFWAWYAHGNIARLYASSVDADRVSVDASGHLAAAGNVRSGSSRFVGADGAYLALANTEARFLTSAGAALPGRFHSLLLSTNYAVFSPYGASVLHANGTVSSFGSDSAFALFDRAGGYGYTIYNTGSVLRFHGHRDLLDRASLDQLGNFAVGGSIAGQWANDSHGGAKLSASNAWGAGATLFPTLGSSGSFELIMLMGPHVPFKAGYGAHVRMAADAAASATWDAGLLGDAYTIRRGTSGTGFFNLQSSGTLHLDRSDAWYGNIDHGRHNLQLRSALFPAKKMSLGYHEDGSATSPGYGFIASGWLGHQWTPLFLQPTGGEVRVGPGGLNAQGPLTVTGAASFAGAVYDSTGTEISGVHVSSVAPSSGNVARPNALWVVA